MMARRSAECNIATAGDYAKRIAACWRANTESIIEVGRLLEAAKAELDHGEFQAMVEGKLLFGPRTTRRLMAIARDARLTKRTHASVLWRVDVYDLQQGGGFLADAHARALYLLGQPRRGEAGAVLPGRSSSSICPRKSPARTRPLPG